jgi:hypothetical protein
MKTSSIYKMRSSFVKIQELANNELNAFLNDNNINLNNNNDESNHSRISETLSLTEEQKDITINYPEKVLQNTTYINDESTKEKTHF